MARIEVEPVSYTESRFLLEAATDADDASTVDLYFLSEEVAREAAAELAKEFEWVQISEFTIRVGKNGKISKTARQKIGNTTVTTTRNSSGKVRLTTSSKVGNTTYTRTR